MDWLLLRGLARESGHWGGLIERLRRARPGDSFHTLDLPGTGLNNHLRSPATIAENRQFVIGASAHLPRPLTLLGMSLGGMVALDWAQNRPKDCAALVLINSSSDMSPPWQRLLPHNWPAIVQLLLNPDPERREMKILGLTSNGSLCKTVAGEWLEIQRLRPVSTSNVVRQLYAASRFSPAASAPPVPVLLLASRQDRLVSWHCSEALSRAWQCPMALHEGAGHDLPLDDPDWLISQLNAHFPAV